MPKTRSLIEQAVLNLLEPVIRDLPDARTHDVFLSRGEFEKIFAAAKRQLNDEAQQRDHRYRREAEQLCRDCVGVVRVDADVLIEHGVEISGITGAWVHAKVFVPACDVEDE